MPTADDAPQPPIDRAPPEPAAPTGEDDPQAATTVRLLAMTEPDSVAAPEHADAALADHECATVPLQTLPESAEAEVESGDPAPLGDEPTATPADAAAQASPVPSGPEAAAIDMTPDIGASGLPHPAEPAAEGEAQTDAPAQAVADPATERAADSEVEPGAEAIAEPMSEAVSEAVAEPAAQPAGDPIAPSPDHLAAAVPESTRARVATPTEAPASIEAVELASTPSPAAPLGSPDDAATSAAVDAHPAPASGAVGSGVRILRPEPTPRPIPVAQPRSGPAPRARTLAATLLDYVRLTRLDRPVGIWLLLWPTLWALWIAGAGRPGEHVLSVFAIGVVLTRSAGCAINDYADRRIDPAVARTRDRPLAAGRISTGEAIVLYALLSLLAFCLVLSLNRLTQIYAIAGAALTLAYPFMKRFTSLPQVGLGFAFSWSVPMAFAAQNGAVPRPAWLLFVTAVLWTVVYDTMYAMSDRAEDLRAGVRSTATLFGDADRVILALMQAMVLAGLLLVGRGLALGHWYGRGLIAGALCFLWQQWLIRDRESGACLRAFQHSHYFGLCVFVGLALDYLYGHH